MAGLNRAIRALRDAAGVLFPTVCAGCGAADVSLCERCRDAVRRSCIPQLHDLAGLAVVSACEYDERMRTLASALKEHGRVDAARVLAPLLRASLLTLLREHPASNVLLVPVPSRRAARTRRGFDHVELLIERAVAASGMRGLRHVRTVRDQAGLGRTARRENLSGALVATPAVAGHTCVIVDDFLTTGATLSEAARALGERDARVLGAAVVARVTQRPS